MIEITQQIPLTKTQSFFKIKTDLSYFSPIKPERDEIRDVIADHLKMSVINIEFIKETNQKDSLLHNVCVDTEQPHNVKDGFDIKFVRFATIGKRLEPRG